MRFLPKIVLATALLAAAPALSAQQIVFQQIPWTSSLDSVRASLGAAGYTYLGFRDEGHTFARDDSTYVMVAMRSDGNPQRFVVLDPARDRGIPERFRTLADSLEGALGGPAERGRRLVRWEAGRTSAVVRVRALGAGRQALETEFRGPEPLARPRNDAARWFYGHSASYAILSDSGGMRLALDTASIATLPDGYLRVRYREDHLKPQAGGVRQYTEEYEFDFYCAKGRARLISYAVLQNAILARINQRPGPWRAPAPGTAEARVMEVVCQASARAPVATDTSPGDIAARTSRLRRRQRPAQGGAGGVVAAHAVDGAAGRCGGGA
jgi:hypothetical protein